MSKKIFNRTLLPFRFPHFCLTLPLVLNEPISRHLNVKDFSLLFSFTTLSCVLGISSITHDFYSPTRNMGIVTVINNSFCSIRFLLFSLIFINEYINERAYLQRLINFLPHPHTILSNSAKKPLF